MKLKAVTWLSAVLLILLGVAVPQAARCDDLIVEHNPTDSSHFTTIQAAIDQARALLVATPTASLIIKVKADPVPYAGSFTPISKVPIQGESETAGTFITASGSNPTVTLNGVNSITIKNLTFLTAVTGISVSNCSSITITNNVFQLGTAGTALQVANSPTTSVVNNTFYGNATAVNTASDIQITNNIFSTNTAAIATNLALTQVSYNDYDINPKFGTDPNSLPNIVSTLTDPLFVDPANHDFHLKAGSPCHLYPAGQSAGNPNFPNIVNSGSFDMGAYGGPNSDSVPRPVSGVTAGTTSPPITVSWNLNLSYQVSGYKVHFGPSAGVDGTGSPQFVAQGSNSATLPSQAGATTPPSVPTLIGLSPSNQALTVTWSPSSADATGYRVYYSTSAVDTSAPFLAVDGGATGSAVLTGLQNGVSYNVAVLAVNQNQLVATVTAVNNNSGVTTPGVSNESALSQALTLALGDPQLSALSPSLSKSPEAIAAYPNLKSEGCFIATAAFGFYSAPQVQALRDFRDRYLLGNAPGRAFVAWYYHYGPYGARLINAHPWLKPPVRVALFPLVVWALVLNGSAPLAKGALLALACLWALLIWRRKLPSPRWNRAGARFLFTLFLLALPALAPGAETGAETRPDRPHWSLEMKGGTFFPSLANWSQFYGGSYTGEYGGALAYKVLRQLEIGLEGSYLKATGKGLLPSSQAQTGEVSYELCPLNLFALARGVFREDQWLVPYAGAGYTRLFYREEIKGQGTTKGSVNGYHGRAGLQFLLDGLEADASRNLYLDYGIHHSYLFLEAKYLHARANTLPAGSVNLGGASYLGGFLFEF